MKMKHWLILAATLSAGWPAPQVFADDQPSPGTPSSGLQTTPPPLAPEKPARKKKSATAKQNAAEPKKSFATDTIKAETPLARGPAVVTQKNVNVRGQAAINSEVIVRLKKGDHVNVIDEITLRKPKLDEPAKWAKVSLPTNSAVWVNASFINAADKTVTPKKLKVRSGPGENYSVLAIIPKGTVVKDIESKGDWMKIETPADAYGFIAAHLLSSAPAAPLAVAAIEPPKPLPPLETKVAPPIIAVAPPEPVVPAAPAVTPVVTPAPVVPPPVTPATPADTVAVATPAVPASPAAPAVEETLVKRVVSREGMVKRSVSIQAPTYFALESLDTGKTINYLYSSTTNLALKDFTGKRILVMGEEMLDERWPNTPVINVDTLQAVP